MTDIAIPNWPYQPNHCTPLEKNYDEEIGWRGEVYSWIELIETIRINEWVSWYHIYKQDGKYELFIFNLVSEICMNVCSDTVEWIKDRIEIINSKCKKK